MLLNLSMKILIIIIVFFLFRNSTYFSHLFNHICFLCPEEIFKFVFILDSMFHHSSFGLLTDLFLLWVDPEDSLMFSFLVGFVYLDYTQLIVFKNLFMLFEKWDICVFLQKRFRFSSRHLHTISEPTFNNNKFPDVF